MHWMVMFQNGGGAIIGSTVVSVVTGVAGSVAYRQYKKSIAWKRHEFSANLIKELTSRPEIDFCFKAIDYPGERFLVVPQKYAPIFKTHTPYVVHDWAVFAAALRPDFNERDPVKLLYRTCFDDLLILSSVLDDYIRAGTLEIDDVETFRYILAQIASPREYRDELPGIPKEKVLMHYCEVYYPRLSGHGLIQRCKSLEPTLPVNNGHA
jgi:hypothetical protein